MITLDTTQRVKKKQDHFRIFRRMAARQAAKSVKPVKVKKVKKVVKIVKKHDITKSRKKMKIQLDFGGTMLYITVSQ